MPTGCAHRLCPLTDSLTISSAGAGGNALPHLLPTLLSLFRSVHPLMLPFSVWVEFEFLQLVNLVQTLGFIFD